MSICYLLVGNSRNTRGAQYRNRWTYLVRYYLERTSRFASHETHFGQRCLTSPALHFPCRIRWQIWVCTDCDISTLSGYVPSRVAACVYPLLVNRRRLCGEYGRRNEARRAQKWYVSVCDMQAFGNSFVLSGKTRWHGTARACFLSYGRASDNIIYDIALWTYFAYFDPGIDELFDNKRLSILCFWQVLTLGIYRIKIIWSFM